MTRPWRLTYQSYRKPNKVQRLIAKAALRLGKEPEKQYRTGRLYND